MKVTIKSIQGWEEAINTLYISRRTWTPEFSAHVHNIVESAFDRYGKFKFSPNNRRLTKEEIEIVKDCDVYVGKLLRWGTRHITLLKFIDIVIMTEGIHRAGQDDIDSHAVRFNNRIIRNSTRLASFGNEKSTWYEGKILTDGEMAEILGLGFPDKIEHDGKVYVKCQNGYILDEYKDSHDVKRGLYMLSIPSNFIAKINLAEWGHVFKERCNDGSANPEVKLWAESVTEQLKEFHPRLTREYILSIEN